MYKYSIEKENNFHNEVGKYTSYGIKIIFVNKNISKNIGYIPDVFIDEKVAYNFINRCNKNELEPVHIYDAIEDALLNT